MASQDVNPFLEHRTPTNSIFVVLISALENASTDVVKSERVGLYVLMLPESSMEKVLSRYRKKRKLRCRFNFRSNGSTNWKNYLSVGFVQNQNAAAGLNAFLGSIAPGVNLALREMYSRVRTRLGFAPQQHLLPRLQVM
ncbi:hypothetical protein Ocin01_05498 [Orchesella cincta]|uniref:Uncharacterized protein n=1 Tax=Orchesella cincta TaxID=48709 RepID=A0A1D2N7D1_ORCCI|nr:hypothetical protein Ocin01_05498 [Orchesella cincta]